MFKKMTLPCDKDGRRKMRGLAAIQCSHEADFRVFGPIVWRISAPRPMSKKAARHPDGTQSARKIVVARRKRRVIAEIP